MQPRAELELMRPDISFCENIGTSLSISESPGLQFIHGIPRNVSPIAILVNTETRFTDEEMFRMYFS